MYFSAVPLLAALAVVCSAQNLGNLPTCAQTCVGNTLGQTGCQLLDIACICKSQGWIASLSCCIAKGCNAADQQTTIQFAAQLCQADGVSLPSVATCASSAASAATSSTVSSIAAGGASTTSMASSTASGSVVMSSTLSLGSTSMMTTPATGTTTPATSSVSAAGASTASALSTAGAAHIFGQGMGVAGAAVAALAFL